MKFKKMLIAFSLSSSFCLLSIRLISAQDLESSSQSSRFEKLETLSKVLYLSETQYYREVDRDKLILGAIHGMLSTLDPHSSFLDEELLSKMQEDTSGEFGGVGIEVAMRDGQAVIISVLDDTPAFKVGLRPMDRIVEINDELLMAPTLDEVVEKMKGEEKQGKNKDKAENKKILKLGILRAGEEEVRRFELIPEIIKIRPVKSLVLDSKYLYLRLAHFSKQASDYVYKAILDAKAKVREQRLNGIILDLRSNPGGLLDEAVDVSSIFLREGVVVSTEAKDPKNKEIRYVKKSGPKDHDTPMIVIINGASASASEIVAAALQDHKRARILGDGPSFGKGSVQTVIKVDEKQAVKLTVAQYMTPRGKKIQAMGVFPDIEFSEDCPSSPYGGGFIREVDLRNHLNSSLETKEEKEERLKREKRQRQSRIEKLEKSKDKKDCPPLLHEKYDVKNDKAVLKAIEVLKESAIQASNRSNVKKIEPLDSSQKRVK